MFKHFVFSALMALTVQSFGAQVTDPYSFVNRAAGLYELQKGDFGCPQLDVAVQYFPQKAVELMLGPDCGDALILGSEERPMTAIFCGITNLKEGQTTAVYKLHAKGHASKINSDAASEIESRLSLTDEGLTLQQTGTFKNGRKVEMACSYKKIP